MTTIKLNNKNQTEINFSYDNGLPYKKAIRPSVEYGDWKKDKNKTLIKITLSNEDSLLFKDLNNINCIRITKIKEEVWFDLDDVYLIFKTNSYLDNRIQSENFSLIFYHNDHWVSSWGFV